MTNLDPKVIVLFFIKNFFSTVYIIPIWFIGISIFEKLWVSTGGISDEIIILVLDGAGVIFFALLVIACYYWAWLTFTRFTYELQQDGLHIRSGVIIPRQVVISYTDIETAEVLVNTFIARFLDLYTVHIKTRELTDTEGIFRKKQTTLITGLTPDAAKFLRTELFKYSHIQTVKKTFFDPISGSYR
jgi:uncharacterized membrane protein YdbT with pleckstrin-like domain